MSELAVINQGTGAQRYDEWRHLISDAFVPLQSDVDDPNEFVGGSLRSDVLGPVQVCEVAGGPQVIQRTRRLINSADPGYYKLGVQLRGYSVLTQDGREAPLTPGDFAVYDTTRYYGLSFDDRFRMLVVMFPRELFTLSADRMADLTAVRISGRQGLGSVASHFLTSVASQATELDGCGAVRLSDNVLDLLTTVFAERLDRTAEVHHSTRRHALYLQIQRHIETHLADVDLSPTTIAAAHHISTRYLHRIFEDGGTSVAGWIRARRLEHARRDLTDPIADDRTVSAIAARWGIVDASAFSRSFKDAYGQSPREYRALHASVAASG